MIKLKFFKNIHGSRIRLTDIDTIWDTDQVLPVAVDKADGSLDITKGYVVEVADIKGTPLDGAVPADKPDPAPAKEEKDADFQWSEIYDNLNVGEIESLVGSVENVKVIQNILAFEVANKNRKTAVSAIKARIESLTSQE
jgi:hypothetical protein